MLPEVERFKLTLREHAQRKGYAVALWGDNLRLDYATLYSEVVYRQQRLRDEHIKVVALALDNGVEAMLWDLAALFEGLSRSEEHTSELQSLMRISYAVFCLKKKK